MKKRLYMDIHVLQVAPASCINRDDSGSPKEMRYGGTIRGRVSSQSWKRAMRMYFAENGEDIGIRTRKVDEFLTEKLIALGIEENTAREEADDAMKKAGLKTEEKDKKPVMTFISETQIDAMAELINKKLNGDYDSKQYVKDLKKAVSDNPTSDMIMFGRMMASDASLNYDAAMQVAHAFTVDESREEYDYFTAVDDLAKFEPGAGHIDSKSYNSGVYYRYANANLSETSELIRMDKGNAAEDARNAAEAFICSMPSGSSNSFANRTLPDTVVINLRNRPISYAPAFLEAVEGKNHFKEAEKRLDEYEKDVDRRFGEPVLRLTLKDMSLDEMLDRLEEVITEEI